NSQQGLPRDDKSKGKADHAEPGNAGGAADAEPGKGEGDGTPGPGARPGEAQAQSNRTVVAGANNTSFWSFLACAEKLECDVIAI
ncbi:MAG: hypothetical protein ACKPKO_30380, partial [Candidatus Fonsibacter sp.]